jgi:hypothetical protein
LLWLTLRMFYSFRYAYNKGFCGSGARRKASFNCGNAIELLSGLDIIN